MSALIALFSRRRLGIVCVFGAALLLGPIDGRRVSAAELHPELKLEGRFDDNIRTNDHPEGDLVRVVAPGLTATSSWPLADWSLWGRRSLTWFSPESALPRETTDAATIKGSRAGRPVDLWLQADYRRSLDDWETVDRSYLVPGSFKSGTGVGYLTMRRLEANMRIAAFNYVQPGQNDATTRQIRLSALPLRGRTQDWLMSYRGRQLDMKGERSLTSRAALAGYRRRHTEIVESRLEAGAAWVNYEDGAGWVTQAAFTAGLTLHNPESDQPFVSILVERDAATTFLAEADRHFGGVLLTASWRRRLDAVGAYTANPMVDQRVAVALEDSVGARMTVSLEGSYGWTRAFRGPESGSDAWRVGVLWTVPLTAGVSGRLSYDFLRQEDRDRPDPLNFDRNRVILSLTGELPGQQADNTRNSPIRN